MCAFVETDDLMQLVDSVLIYLSNVESLGLFSVKDILDNHGGEIKTIFCTEIAIEFALAYIADKSAEIPGKYSLSPEKV